MKVDTKSLARTIDALDEVIFSASKLPRRELESAVRWIASRQGMSGAYRDGMFAPTLWDLQRGIQCFTGERISSNAGISHVLGEEACRILVLLNVQDERVQTALRLASGCMNRVLESSSEARQENIGMYCCGTCSCSLWRHLAAGGLGNVEARLENGLRILKKRRNGDGRWSGFPFYYTLLALSEIPLPSAINEIKYAAPVCERLLKRRVALDKFSHRRRELMGRVLARC